MNSIQLGIPPMSTPMPYLINEYLNQANSEMAQKLTQADQHVQHAIAQATYAPPVQFNPIQNSQQSSSQSTGNQSGSGQRPRSSSNTDMLTQYKNASSQRSTATGGVQGIPKRNSGLQASGAEVNGSQTSGTRTVAQSNVDLYA